MQSPTPLKQHPILKLSLLTAVILALSACGKVGPPTPPNGEKLEHPKTYPTS